MIYLQDNDLLLKLAAWNLLEEAMTVLHATPTNVRVLDTLQRQLEEPRDDWQAQYGMPVLKRVLHFVSKVEIIGDLPFDLSELAMMGRVPKLDAGEALLFAVTRDLPDFRVLTGDKQCLYAVHRSVPCQPIAARLRGNVLHLEQIVFRLLEQKGLNPVRNAIRNSAAPDADLAIRGAFGQRWEHGSDLVNTKIRESIRQLHSDCGGLLDLSDTERPVF